MLAAYTAASRHANQGQRVVEGQRLMQAASDIFLGWRRVTGDIFDGQAHDFYVRQLRDWKFSLDIEDMDPARMQIYGQLCAWTLARAHARSGDSVAIAAYLGLRRLRPGHHRVRRRLRGPERTRPPGTGHRRRHRRHHCPKPPITTDPDAASPHPAKRSASQHPGTCAGRTFVGRWRCAQASIAYGLRRREDYEDPSTAQLLELSRSAAGSPERCHSPDWKGPSVNGG